MHDSMMSCMLGVIIATDTLIVSRKSAMLSQHRVLLGPGHPGMT